MTGFKGVANAELTGEYMFNIGKAAAYVLSRRAEGRLTAVVGKDTRASGDMLTNALAAGLASMGVDVTMVGAMSAPAISYLTRLYGATVGFSVSLPYDEFKYNGVKMYSESGVRLYEDETEMLAIACNDWQFDPLPHENIGKIAYKSDCNGDYINYVKSTVTTDLKGLKIAVDCANGTNSYIAPKIFEDLGATVFAVNTEPDGKNINSECGIKNPQMLKETVVSRDADIGIVFDGEGSLMLVADDSGRMLSGDAVLGICAMDMFNKGNLNDNTVVTDFANAGFKAFAESIGVNVYETHGDFKSVENVIFENGYSAGGSKNGCFILPQFSPTSDGLVAALRLLSVLKLSGKTVSILIGNINLTPQAVCEANVKKENIEAYKTDSLIMAEIQRLNDEFGDNGTVIIRPNFDETAVEITVEGENVEYITERADELRKILELKYN